VFTSADPATADSNLYRYVKNNPINEMDPSGLEEFAAPEDIEIAQRYTQIIKQALPYLQRDDNSTTVAVARRAAQITEMFSPESHVFSTNPEIVYPLIRFYEANEQTIVGAAALREANLERENEHLAHAQKLEDDYQNRKAEEIAKANFKNLDLAGRVSWMLGKATANGLFEKFGPEIKQQLLDLADLNTLRPFVIAFAATFLAGAAFGPKGALVVTLIITAMGLLGSLHDILALADLFLRIRNASSYNELENMVPELVQVLSKLAIDGALTILLRKVSKAGGKKGQEYEIDPDPSRANTGPPLKRKQDASDSSTTDVPDGTLAPISGIADAAAIRGIRAAGVFNHTAKSLDDALASIRKAMPDTVELPRAIAGRPYPSPPPGVKKWFQIHPPEPGVGNNLPHIKFVDWTNGKKGTGGSWGHIFFPE